MAFFPFFPHNGFFIAYHQSKLHWMKIAKFLFEAIPEFSKYQWTWSGKSPRNNYHQMILSLCQSKSLTSLQICSCNIHWKIKEIVFLVTNKIKKYLTNPYLIWKNYPCMHLCFESKSNPFSSIPSFTKKKNVLIINLITNWYKCIRIYIK